MRPAASRNAHQAYMEAGIRIAERL